MHPRSNMHFPKFKYLEHVMRNEGQNIFHCIICMKNRIKMQENLCDFYMHDYIS
jgi:hypothetical protein